MASLSRRAALRAAAGIGTAAIISTLAEGSSAAQAPAAGEPLSLGSAIRAFNAAAQEDPIGRQQPPLTEEEVVAAIRWWQFDRDRAPVTDAEFRDFQQIAETRRLPAGAEFEVLTSFQPNDDLVFDRWSVRIRMPRTAPEKKGWTYAYVIRERAIGSRRIGPEERKVIEKWDAIMRKQGGIGSFQRADYARERQAAAEKDRAAADR